MRIVTYWKDRLKAFSMRKNYKSKASRHISFGKVLKKRIRNKKEDYLVRWSGYNSDFDSWLQSTDNSVYLKTGQDQLVLDISVSAVIRMSYGQSEWSDKCCGVFCVCEHNDAVCSPIRIVLFDDVIFMCF